MCNFEGVELQGPVVQLVRTPPCHGGGQGFESPSGRQAALGCGQRLQVASVAQLVEQGTENPRVVGSIPTGGTTCSANRQSAYLRI